MSFYRRKPAVIEAMQWDGRDYGTLAAFLGPEMYSHVSYSSPAPYDAPSSVYLTTLEGIVTVPPGDWIIKGGQGEFYPCPPGIFKARYEPAPETTAYAAAEATVHPETVAALRELTGPAGVSQPGGQWISGPCT